MVENDKDSNVLREVDQYEEEEYRLHEEGKEPEFRVGGSELMWLALHEPELHEIVAQVIDSEHHFKEVFKEKAEIHRKKFMYLLKVFLAARINPKQWHDSKEREEFDNYILIFNHHFDRKECREKSL